jgi:hypothetical protein
VSGCLCADHSQGRGGSTAKQIPPQPGTIPALGLRAGTMAVLLYRRPALERGNIVLFSSWLRYAKRSALTAGRRTQAPPLQQAGFRPRLEALEDRWLPSTLTVTSLQDSGSGTLRAEIAAANSGDTIVFSSTLSSATTTKQTHGKPKPPPTTSPTITLTSGELLLSKNLTIQGPTFGQLTISGNYGSTYNGPSSRVFEVIQNATVTLSGLTISKGDGVAAISPSSWDGYGGAILNHGRLTLSGCTVSSSYAIFGAAGGPSEGGGIFSDGTLTLTSCTVSGNEASDGGGIYNAGTATVVESAISNNSAWPPSNSGYNPLTLGGGIFNHGTMTLSGCTISGNFANYRGGGIFNDGNGTLTLSGCTVSGNSASYDGGYGGAIFNDGTLTVSGCTVSANSMDGIYNDAAGTLTIENSSKITGNQPPSGYAGGEIDVENQGLLYLDSTNTIVVLEGNAPVLI